MYSDVPNLVQTFGYINASWTLRADLTAEWTLSAARGDGRDAAPGASRRGCAPRIGTWRPRPWIDDFTPSYIQRVMQLFPKQGDRAPWLNTQDYARDTAIVRKAPIEDGVARPSTRRHGIASVVLGVSASVS